MSLKLKITLWYMLIITIMSALVLALVNSFGEDMLRRDTQTRLSSTVNDFARMRFSPEHEGRRGGAPDRRQEDMPPLPEGTIPPAPEGTMPPRPEDAPETYGDGGRGYFKDGVFIAVYDSGDTLIEGGIPYELDEVPENAADGFDTVTQNGETYYVYTVWETDEDGDEYRVCGVVMVNEDGALAASVMMNVLIAAAMIVIASAGGYFILRKALLPVNRMTRTAREIAESSDLSRRIRIGAGHDEIHELANTFDAMLDRIEQTVEREKQFTSDASHELRTPAAVVMSECEYMLDCAKTPEEFRESVESVKEQAERMSRLISELLTISRMDRNTLVTEFEKVDVSELLTFVCDEQEELHGDGITLSRDIPEGITVRADRSLLARLFINLISNAYTYGKPGGHIKVTLGENGGDIITEVEDDGIGISEEDLPRIWERFYQADPSRTSGSNMGLGLSMVKWIAECHGGSVSVKSKLGVGSTFTFIMPKSPEKRDP